MAVAAPTQHVRYWSCPDNSSCQAFTSCHMCASLPQGRPCLENVSLSIPAGTFTVITGEVGSGKSSLLSTILGELVPQEGSCRLSPRLLGPGRIAYVGQTPWVMNGTVRDNILMGQPYDPDRVQQVRAAGSGRQLSLQVCMSVDVFDKITV